jgi:hypothetical protein
VRLEWAHEVRWPDGLDHRRIVRHWRGARAGVGRMNFSVDADA